MRHNLITAIEIINIIFLGAVLSFALGCYPVKASRDTRHNDNQGRSLALGSAQHNPAGDYGGYPDPNGHAVRHHNDY